MWGPLAACGDLKGNLGPMEAYGYLWEPLGTYGGLSGPMVTYGNLWGPSGTYGDL